MKAVQKQVTILDKTEIKRTGVTLYTILSSDNVTKYFATSQAGKCTLCECKGFEIRHTCRHAQYIEQLEAMSHYDVNAVASKIVAGVLIGDAYEVRGVELVQSLAQIRREAEETAAAYYRMSFMPY